MRPANSTGKLTALWIGFYYIHPLSTGLVKWSRKGRFPNEGVSFEIISSGEAKEWYGGRPLLIQPRVLQRLLNWE